MSKAEALASNPFADIYEQYVDEASFLWLLRSIAVDQPQYLPTELAHLESRIDAHLDGLFVSPVHVWEICEAALALKEPGEVFVSAVVAFRNMDAANIQQVVEVALESQETFDALVSAMGWLPSKVCQPWLEKFIRSKDLDHKRLAVAVYGILRQDPGEYLGNLLEREDCVAHEALYCECLKLVGLLKRVDLAPALLVAAQSDSDAVLFWSRWSATLLGDRKGVSNFESLVAEDGPFQRRALEIYFRAAPMDQARQQISAMVKTPEMVRIAILASSALGDPQVVPWLISQMEAPEHARVAGQAFTCITGIHLEENDLSIHVPSLEDIAGDDSEELILDEDENLPWPNVEKLKAVWQKYGSHYTAGQRYFVGKPICEDHLSAQLASGFQRHRNAAAMELALLCPSQKMPNSKRKLESL